MCGWYVVDVFVVSGMGWSFIMLHGHCIKSVVDPRENSCSNAVANGDPNKINQTKLSFSPREAMFHMMMLLHISLLACLMGLFMTENCRSVCLFD